MKLSNILVYFTLIFLTSCNGVGTAEFKGSAIRAGGGQSGESGTVPTLTFSGLSSISNKNDSSITLNWPSHADAVAYDVFDSLSGSLVFKNTVVGQAQNSITLTNLTPGANYKFRVRIRNASGLYDTNTNDISVTMNTAPDEPSALSLINPVTSPGFTATPTIRVSGVKNGDTIKLFSDSSCSTELGSIVATGTTADITSSVLPLGSYSLYANSTNASNNASTCSTTSISYEYSLCPTGYISVPANAGLGMSSFCVAQFEMKNVGGIATSQAASTPWVSITQTASKTACTAIGTGYDLISNPEWMVIAFEIEKTAANWSGAIPVVGTGVLNRGHSDNSPNTALAVTDINDPYIGTGNTPAQAVGSGWEQKRTHTFSNGQVIWDFAGNVWEWTDWSLGGGLTAGPTNCTAAWTQFPVVSCAGLAAADYMPGNPGGVIAANYNSTYGLGRFYGGNGGAAQRGGFWFGGADAGVFSFWIHNHSAVEAPGVGFRCVFRP
jgi:hypothetical protein